MDRVTRNVNCLFVGYLLTIYSNKNKSHTNQHECKRVYILKSNLLIIRNLFAVYKVFPTWRIVPEILNDPDVVHPLPWSTSRTGGKQQHRNTNEQLQCTRHVKMLKNIS